MKTERYKEALSRVLKMLNVTVPEEKKNPIVMIQVLKDFADGPIMSQSDADVRNQVRKLVEAIEADEAPQEINKIIEQLEHATDFRDKWD